MTAPRKGLTTGQPPQGASGFAPYDEYGREASGPWVNKPPTPPVGYEGGVPSNPNQGEVVSARHSIQVARPGLGQGATVVPGAPDLIQSVHARTGALAPRQPAVERSPDGIRPGPGGAPTEMLQGLTDHIQGGA